MRAKELNEFKKSNYLTEGHEYVLQLARPIFGKLIDDLIELPENATESAKLKCFETCVYSINTFEQDIETVEREAFCEALYTIGSLISLDKNSKYIDNWRGDW